MTHDKLLKKIQSNYEKNKHFRDEPDWKSFSALRAVVELHKPAKHSEMNEFADEGIGCSGCGYDFDYAIWTAPYPCQTIQAIQKELN
jgi:hypothetical protein